MKKMFFAAVAAALALAACTPAAKEFKLSGTGLPETLNGTYAKFYDMDQNVKDSVLIENGTFNYVVPANDTVVSTLVLGESSMVLSNEEGDFTLTYTTDEATGAANLRCDGDANSSIMKAQEMKGKIDELRASLNAESEKIIAAIGEAEPTEEQMQQLSDLREKYSADSKDIYNSYYTKGGNKMIDWYAFMGLAGSWTPAEFVENFDAAGSLVKNDKDLAKMYVTMQAAARTDVGQQFLDYELVNPAGETKMLSEFRAEGKYFLLDFFASWCGPCKMSMPVIAEIEKEFANVLTSASIAVWEQDTDGAAYAQAVKDMNITWPTFQDSKSDAATLYGLIGVPTFILVSPEGEILMRGHDIKAVQTKLRELNK